MFTNLENSSLKGLYYFKTNTALFTTSVHINIMKTQLFTSEASMAHQGDLVMTPPWNSYGVAHCSDDISGKSCGVDHSLTMITLIQYVQLSVISQIQTQTCVNINWRQ